MSEPSKRAQKVRSTGEDAENMLIKAALQIHDLKRFPD